MKKTKLQRLTALLLAVVFLFCGGAVTVGATDTDGATGGSSTTTVTTADIKALLNSATYDEYVATYFDTVPRAEGAPIVINGVDYDPEQTNVKFDDGADGVFDDSCISIREYLGVKGLYTPGNGIVSWKVNGIKEKARFSISIEYYPIENKSASIERVFYINGSVPFKEARYLNLSKVWKNEYPSGSFVLSKKESDADGAAYVAAAAQIGIKASYDAEKRTVSYEMPAYWTQDITNLVNEKQLRFFKNDIDRNEIRPSIGQSPEWRSYELKDSNGYYTESFEFVVEPNKNGDVILSLEGVNEPMVIRSITLYAHEDNVAYEEYLKNLGDKANASGKDTIKIEGEDLLAASSKTIYAINDNSCAINSPTDTTRTVLNTIGGEKWQTAGQWVRYGFAVQTAGMYDIAIRFRQNILDGLYTSRSLSISSYYKDANGNLVLYDEDSYLAQHGNTAGFYDGVPFDEAAKLQFAYDQDWQSSFLTADVDRDDTLSIYFEDGVIYMLELEVTIGEMGEIVREVQQTLDAINDCYLNILQLTGTNPDKYRDYGFSRVMPDTINQMEMAAQRLAGENSDGEGGIVKALEKISGEASSMTSTLERVAWLLHRMTDEDNIAANLSQLKTYIGTLGTWLGDAKTQPLQLDYLMIQPTGGKLPAAKPGFFKMMAHEFGSFFQSFIRNYDRMGATVEATDAATKVWLAYGRDQSQVIRNLINNDFTPNKEEFGDKDGNEIIVDLKLVAGGTLLPSILSGAGPDVYIGLGEDSVINYAIRGALIAIENMEGFKEMCLQEYEDENGNIVDNSKNAQFNEAAMIVMGIEDSVGEMHYYGLPETQGFSMMFVREDILADLDIDIPRTWDDIYAAIPTLQANNMQIGVQNDYKIFLYQMGGELFADNGMRINLDSNVALTSFNMMCNLFTQYGFPYKYDFANRFRTGEMPIGFASYTATYNHLKVFATEIDGLWGFYPLPGIIETDEKGNEIYDENGDPVINNVAVSACSAIVMIVGCRNEYNAWQFMKWHVGAECQATYSEEMCAIIGPSAKHSTANLQALADMPWTSEELLQLGTQFNKLASIPNYPGSYIIGRYTNFAFLSAYNSSADPSEELLSYITTINKEITRKRDEFDLETLEIGQTLAEKRIGQAAEALKAIHDSSDWSDSYNSLYERSVGQYGLLHLTQEDYAALFALASDFEAANATLFEEVIEYINEAATALKTYEAYK
ncbi:MAG: extracellular solute-binding protein [Clostridia bacterium]|nr:extracellular solute-binding protein [Clostridia bacterium]